MPGGNGFDIMVIILACTFGFAVNSVSNHLNAGCAAAASGLVPANAMRVALTVSAVKVAAFAAAPSTGAGVGAAGDAVCAVGEDEPAAAAAAALAAASSFFFASAAALRAAAFALAFPLALAFGSGLSGLPGLVQAFLS